MSLLKHKILSLLLVAMSIALILNCGGSSSATGGGDTSGTVSGTSGTLNGADGSPLSGATVAVSTSSSSSSLKKLASDNFGRWFQLPKLTDDDGETCDDLSGVSDILAQDCTSADGAYSLTGEIPCGETLTFTAKKGSFSLAISITLSCPDDADGDGDTSDETVAIDDAIGFDDDCTSASTTSAADLVSGTPAFSIDSDSCDFDVANMAVVTGNYDEIQNVLAKLGYGEVDEYGELDTTQTFDFTLIDGNYTLDDETYDNLDDFFSSVDNLNEFDIIFLNCGNSYEDLSTDSAVQAVLQEYVDNGGKLYVTDWSYMFIEQNYPSFMDFLDGGDDVDTAETPIDAAKAGTGDITSDATVDAEMAEWLDNVYVNDGTVAEDCYYIDDTTANAILGARNADGTVTIGDFLSSWVVMEGLHANATEESTIWVSGPITHYSDTIDDAPLTATRDQGDGRILYSSYHTAHSCPTLGFWPQERILQYLVFEL